MREVSEADVDIILKWENTPEFWDITENEGPFSRSDIAEFVKQSSSLTVSGQQRYIILNYNNESIGAVDLFGYNPIKQSAGIGILIADKENRNAGLATDALNTLIQFLKKENLIKELNCIIYPENIASIRLFLQAGFKKTARETFKGREVTRYVKAL